MNLTATFETIFFATDEPLTLKRLGEVLPDVNQEALDEALKNWIQSLEGDDTRGLKVTEVAGGYLLATKPEHAEVVDRLLERRKKRTLSQAALETLAVIAYRQPITRAEIEAIRGVNIDSIVHTLLQRKLIKIAGRKEVPGHPFLYKTTKQFLHHFGLRAVSELPRIDELTEALAQAELEETGEPAQPVTVAPTQTPTDSPDAD